MSHQQFLTKTITAIATPSGRGGVGIIRISGSNVPAIAQAILGKLPSPRQAEHLAFKDGEGKTIDVGLALFFKAPNSFTGEDVLELQGHGGPVVLDMLLRRILEFDCRLARPGEFSERAFLNDKLDLTQAEAIADLIDSTSEHAARCAMRSLQGKFSERITSLVDELIQLRTYVEAAIDFPEEEIDFLADKSIASKLEKILLALNKIIDEAQQGVILREGITIVIAGEPNAGKSTLLNCLSGRESAIVTDVAGTTRDVMREQVLIDDIPLHIIDTAGLRETDNIVEQEGVRRAWLEIEKADIVLFIEEATNQTSFDIASEASLLKPFPKNVPTILIRNKIDLTDLSPGVEMSDEITVINMSAKMDIGVDLLRQHLKDLVGYNNTIEGTFLARRRHLDALHSARDAVSEGVVQLTKNRAGELLAEELRCAQQLLAEITGAFSSDDLLGKIFSSFCIGK